MATSILLLPSELKSLIAKLLFSESPKSLAALAQIHTAYHREAEKALYGTHHIYADSDDSLKCMETLATNSEKAALVRFLTIEYASGNTKNNRRVTKYLSKSLINMRTLSDFRIKTCAGGVEAQLIKGLGKILCQGHNQLQTFYSPDLLNISRIIKSQTALQILGLYTRRPCGGGTLRNLLKTLSELRNAQSFLPLVFRLEYGRICTVPDHISIFPAFYSVDRRDTIPQVLVQSFRRDEYFFIELSIYLIDSSDMPSIYKLSKDVAVSFPQIQTLNLWFEHRPPREIKEKFSFFPNLRNVRIGVWSSL